MYISMSDMLIALSTSLDYVESEVFGVTRHHSKRVAYLCARMGAEMGLAPIDLARLAGAAVMHDNALTEYLAVRRAGGSYTIEIRDNELGAHAEMGERNMERLPFYEEVKGAVLYHHENADGSGPFSKTAEETPVYAQIIHLADQVDAHFDLGSIDSIRYGRLASWLTESRDSLFASDIVDLFMNSCAFSHIENVRSEPAERLLSNMLSANEREYSAEDMVALAEMFAAITDCKSEFTSRHSRGIADKSAALGRYYGENDERITQLYVAGAFHDIGKMAVPIQILEKPGRLTVEEFEIMQTHVEVSYQILKNIHGLEEETDWAYRHHEKLDGSGYPQGLTEEHLSFEDRLMGCIDIYQALIEDRPYKKGISHDGAIKIMEEMADDGKIDAAITHDIDMCFGKNTDIG